MLGQSIRDMPGKSLPIDRQGLAGGDTVGIGSGDNKRAQRSHLLFKTTDGVCRIVGTERVTADQLCETVCAMRGRPSYGPHFVEDDWNVGRGQLPSCLAAGEPRSDDDDGA